MDFYDETLNINPNSFQIFKMHGTQEKVAISIFLNTVFKTFWFPLIFWEKKNFGLYFEMGIRIWNLGSKRLHRSQSTQWYHEFTKLVSELWKMTMKQLSGDLMQRFNRSRDIFWDRILKFWIRFYLLFCMMTPVYIEKYKMVSLSFFFYPIDYNNGL